MGLLDALGFGKKEKVSVASKVKVVPQASNRICWLACYKMMYSYKNKPMGKVEDKLRDGGVLPKDAKEVGKPMIRGLLDEEFAPAGKALEMGALNTAALKDLGQLRGVIKDFGPVWTAIIKDGGGKHVIVITGVDEETKQIEIIDPWYESHESEVKAMWVSHAGMKPAFRNLLYSAQVWSPFAAEK